MAVLADPWCCRCLLNRSAAGSGGSDTTVRANATGQGKGQVCVYNNYPICVFIIHYINFPCMPRSHPLSIHLLPLNYSHSALHLLLLDRTGKAATASLMMEQQHLEGQPGHQSLAFPSAKRPSRSPLPLGGEVQQPWQKPRWVESSSCPQLACCSSDGSGSAGFGVKPGDLALLT